MNIEINGKEFEIMEPEIVKEAWNIYDLADGSRIRTRTIMTRLLWPRGAKIATGVEIDIRASFQNVVAVFSPEKLRGAPNPKPPHVSIAKTMAMDEVNIKKAEEEWNVYNFPRADVSIKLKMVVSSIFRIPKLFNEDGDPYYVVNSSHVLGFGART